jgi:hypothetical protein
MGVEWRYVKRFSKSTQKGERANVGVCIIEGYSQVANEETHKNVPLPEFSLAICEETASRMALQQSSASGA